MKAIYQTIKNGNRQAKVTYKNETKEYVVRLYIDNILIEGGDYFTSSKQDAIQTANSMIFSEYKSV